MGLQPMGKVPDLRRLAGRVAACGGSWPVLARPGIPVGSIGRTRRRYLDKLRRDPAMVQLISAETAER